MTIKTTSRLSLLTAVFVIAVALSTALPAAAGFLPDSSSTLRDRFVENVSRGDREGMLALFYWANVDVDSRNNVEREVDRLLNGDIDSIEVAELPENVPDRFASAGRNYSMNVKPVEMLVVRVKEIEGIALIGFPIGVTPEGHALAITVPEPRPYQSPTRRKDELAIRVSADPSITTELVCTYYASVGGERKIVSHKGSGTFVQRVSGTAFESCAAKKRSGSGVARFALLQDGVEIFSASADQVDTPMIYRTK